MVTTTIIQKKSIHHFLLVFFLLLYPFSAHALFGGKIDSYSADSVAVESDGKVLSESKYFISPDASRIDGLPMMTRPGAEKMNLSVLILVKQNKQYFYNHNKKLVYESPVDEKNLTPGYKNLGDIQSERVLGEEKVSGYKCVKKEIVTTIKMMGMTTKSTVIVWKNKRFDMPLKVQDEKGGIMEMRNIKKGMPDKKHFKPIQGYKKVDNMMAVMGMDFGRMAMEEEPSSSSTDATPQDNPCSKWAKAILNELECMSVASGPVHGQCVARGITEESKELSSFGFVSGNPPYSIAITSLGSDRYNIEVQAMTSMNDRQEKIVHFKSQAAHKLPKRPVTSVPEGKILFTLTMNYDLKHQLGIASSHEVFDTIRNFVDLVVLDPQKLEKKGFPLFQRMDTQLQLLYLGKNRWKLHNRKGDVGPMLVYEDTKWKTTDAPLVEEPEKPPQPKDEDPLPQSPGVIAVQGQVDIHAGDVLKEENIMGPMVMLTLKSTTPISEIIPYYEKALLSKGWKTRDKFINGQQGVLVMGKGSEQFMVSTKRGGGKDESTFLYQLTMTTNAP